MEAHHGPRSTRAVALCALTCFAAAPRKQAEAARYGGVGRDGTVREIVGGKEASRSSVDASTCGLVCGEARAPAHGAAPAAGGHHLHLHRHGGGVPLSLRPQAVQHVLDALVVHAAGWRRAIQDARQRSLGGKSTAEGEKEGAGASPSQLRDRVAASASCSDHEQRAQAEELRPLDALRRLVPASATGEVVQGRGPAHVLEQIEGVVGLHQIGSGQTRAEEQPVVQGDHACAGVRQQQPDVVDALVSLGQFIL